MKILIACEYSGTVRDAFIALGHDAVSCDLLDSERPGPHYKGDVFDIIGNGWDLMIAHPPCTHLAVSGSRWFYLKQKEQAEALDFVRRLLDAPIPYIALENPVSVISSKIRKPNQIIQPWQFGHPESKSTCLWLKCLPRLNPSNVVRHRYYRCGCGNVFPAELGKYGCCPTPAKMKWDNQTKSGQNKLPPSPDRWKERSRTYQGIADAMAQQWVEYIIQAGKPFNLF